MVLAMFLMLILGCSSTQMGVNRKKWDYYSGQPSYINNSYSGSIYRLNKTLDNKLSELNSNADIIQVYPGLYDVEVNMKVNAVDLKNLLNSEFKTETVGVMVGFMIVAAAFVKEETDKVEQKFRNVTFNISGVTIGHIPIAKCRRYMYWVKNKKAEEALVAFSKDIVLYNFQ